MTEDSAAATFALGAAISRARVAGLRVQPGGGVRLVVTVRCPGCGSAFAAVAAPRWRSAAGALQVFVNRHAPHVASVEGR